MKVLIISFKVNGHTLILVSSINLEGQATFKSTNKQYRVRVGVLLNSHHLNGDKVEFQTQTQNIEPPYTT